MPDCELRQRDAIFGTLLQEQDREDHALQQHTEKSLPKSLSLGSKSTASSDDRGQTSFPPEVQLLDEALKNTKWLHLVHEDENIHPEGLSLDELRKSLPAHVFKKDLYRSLRWLVFDLTIVFVALAGLKTLYRNEIPILDPAHVLASYAYGRAELEWSTSWALYLLVTTARLSAYVLLSGLGGFFMWSNFVVGHDCGHGSFSENRQLNFLFGNLTHGAILVPFQSWARSHRLHHMYHNHIEKDYSFPWSHDPQFDNQHVEFLAKYPAVPAALYPIFGYAFYLLWPQQYGGVDGSHFFPKVFDGCRLWETVDKEELAKCWISVGVVACYLTFYLGWFFASPAEFAALYLPCWFFFCFNLYTVTFLQHHSPETRIYVKEGNNPSSR
eukprot:g12198.t1